MQNCPQQVPHHLLLKVHLLPPPLLLDCAEIAEVEEEVEVSPEEDEAFDDRRALSSLPAKIVFLNFFIIYLFWISRSVSFFSPPLFILYREHRATRPP